jgi:hypothetical protein
VVSVLGLLVSRRVPRSAAADGRHAAGVPAGIPLEHP